MIPSLSLQRIARSPLTRFSLGAVLMLALLALAGCGPSEPAARGEAKYYCPMHPTYTSDRMGDCPICNMKLVPIRKGTGETNTHAGHVSSEAVAGRITIAISPEKQQMIGVRFAPVERRTLARVIRAPATFEHDETRLYRIAPRFGGWLHDLKANFTGQPVSRGDPLVSVYSPELVAAENEYLVAWRRFQEVRNRPEDARFEAARSLFESARRRLELWEISETDMQELQERGVPREYTVIRSPVDGHVLTKRAVEGGSFMAGETLYEIADLSRLWVRASIFEPDLPLVHAGQPARIKLPFGGHPPIETTVAFVYPHIDPVTRQGAVRLEVENIGHHLRPDLWAEVEIEASEGEMLAVPASAVIDTGTRAIAFVHREDHHFEPREVSIGRRTPDFVEVVEGLKEGESVVTRALFLVDSESQLRAALAGMGASGGNHNH